MLLSLYCNVLTSSIEHSKNTTSYISHALTSISIPGSAPRERTLEFFSNTQSLQCWHYCQICISIFLQFSSYLSPVMSVNMKLEGKEITFWGYMFSGLVNSRAKRKLAMFIFLYWGEFVKNPIVVVQKQSQRECKKNHFSLHLQFAVLFLVKFVFNL